MFFIRFSFPGLVAILGMSLANAPQAASVLMISVDGMKPGYVFDADAHQLKVPFLRSLLHDGAYARGVKGVWPTVTYPNHTTLVTGVTPAEHGIYNNLEFDPRHSFGDAWYWYARQIRVPTLWQAAHEAGLSTASVGWPVTVGAAIDTLIPEYWRSFQPSESLNPSDIYLLASLSKPTGVLEEMQARLGPYMAGNDPSRPGDEIKTRFALDIIEHKKPRFMTVHLSSLDEAEHEHGPFSTQADRVLEDIDGWIAQLATAARRADPAVTLFVVSDHGFVDLTHRINLVPALQQRAPQAQLWPAGGMAAVVMRDNSDAALRATRAALQILQDDSANGIANILAKDEMERVGAFPTASFLVVMKSGYYVAGNPASEPAIATQGTGGHGFSPEYPEMRAAFFVTGPGIAQHRDLGDIDMRRIAPTVAQVLEVRLTHAAQPPLPLRE